MARYTFDKRVDVDALRSELSAAPKLHGIPKMGADMVPYVAEPFTVDATEDSVTVLVPDSIVQERDITAGDIAQVVANHVVWQPRATRGELYRKAIETCAATPDVKHILTMLFDRTGGDKP